EDAFVTSFTANGTYRWAKLFASGPEDAEGVTVDATGNVYVTGNHAGGTDIVPGSTYSNSAENIFLKSYDSAGTFRWSWTVPSGAPQMTSTSEAFAAVSKNGDLYTAGDFDVSLNAGL